MPSQKLRPLQKSAPGVLTILKNHWMVCMALHVNIFAALTDHFADTFVRENVARVFGVVVRYDVRKFDADAILYRDTRCKKIYI